MEIYLDILVVLNTYMTWLILSLTAALTHTRSSGRMRVLGSIIGGFSALIILIPTPDKLIGFTVLAIKVLSCVLIVAVGFYRQSLKKYAILCLAFLLVNFLLSGALCALQNLIHTQIIAASGWFIYFNISPTNLILSTAVIYLCCCKVSKLFSKSLGKLNSYRVDFTVGCKAFSLDGVADTGNTAKDLFSGLPVIICTGVKIEEGGGLRAIPFKTVAGEGLLYAFLPETLSVTDESGKSREVSALVAGIPETGERRAIFNPEILAD